MNIQEIKAKIKSLKDAPIHHQDGYVFLSSSQYAFIMANVQAILSENERLEKENNELKRVSQDTAYPVRRGI